ncbi:hypothetical protein ACHWQZ_G015333 [Mnemiopsis leidyi]
MIRSLLLLLLVGVCLARVNYRTTSKLVSEEEKERILNSDDDDAAFAAFLNVYDDIEPAEFRGSTTPDDLEKERNRQKRIFVRNIQSIKEHNKRFRRGEVSYKMVVNSFVVMDEDNRKMFLGLGKDSVKRRPGLTQGQVDTSLFNATEDRMPSMSRGLGSTRTARSLDWRNKLGPIKDQQTCGSCWTYPATALLEFAIEKTTREKIPLSEQQLLDCTYEDQSYDACNGGWYYTAWDYIIKNGNKLARESDYRYRNSDGTCYDNYYSNALAGRVKLDSYYKVPASQVIDKMQISPLAVAFFVEQSFYAVGNGVFEGCYTYNPSNHAVTLTGYGNGYWEIRNSWGRDWGNGGYARFRRSGTTSICNLLSDVYAIRTSSRSDGNDDRDEDNDDDDQVDPDRCSDNSQYASSCGDWADSGFCAAGNEYHEWMQENCMKSCDACREEEETDCVDLRTEAECRDWKDYEYCTVGEYVEWMRTNCAKTCDVCEEEREEEEEEEEEEEDEEETDCRDNNEHAANCPEWRNQGYCQNDNSHEYYDWMSVNCAYTCGTCPEVEEEPTESDDCENSHENCETWATSGYCSDDKYQDYMRTNCRRSCDTCDEAATEDPTQSEELLEHRKVTQSSTVKVKKTKMEAALAVDGDDRTMSQTKCSKKNAWFRYVFREASRVNAVEIDNGNLDKQREKLNGAEIYVQEVGGLKRKCGSIQVVDSSSKASQTYRVDCDGAYGSGIEILQPTKYKKKKCLEMKEVRVYGLPGEGSEEESEDDNNGCPGGTIRCPDGLCKHQHMCKG